MASPSSLAPPGAPGPSNFNSNPVSLGGLSRSSRTGSLAALASAPSPSPPSRNASLSSSSWDSGSRATSPTPPSSLTDSVDSDSSSGSRTTRMMDSSTRSRHESPKPVFPPASTSGSGGGFVVTSRTREYIPPTASHQIPHHMYDESSPRSASPSSQSTPVNSKAPASRVIPLPINPPKRLDSLSASPTPSQRIASRSPPHSVEAKTTLHLQSSVNAKGQRMVNQYVRLKTIGRGSHGKVWLCAEPSARSSDVEDDDEGSHNGSNLGHRKGSFETEGEDGAGDVRYCAIKSVARDGYERHRSLREAKARKHSSHGVSGGIGADDKIKREVAIMKRLDHRNIVKLKEVIDDPKSKKVFMVLEFMAGGEIVWQDEDRNPTMTVDEARRTFRDVVLGLEYLHYQGIIHRDIKPANLLWTEDHSTVKISDFGVSHVSDALVRASPGGTEGEDSDLRKTAGSPAFFAPELCAPADALPSPLREVDEEDDDQSGYFSKDDVRDMSQVDPRHQQVVSQPVKLHGKPSNRSRPIIGKGIDVWALGVTLYCLLFGDTPFTARTEYELYNVIVNQGVRVPQKMGREGMWTGVGEKPADAVGDGVEGREVVDLLSRLLEKDPVKRITLAEVKHHPWVLRNLQHPESWLSETDPSQVGSVKITDEDVEHATQQRGSVEKFARPRHRPSIRRALNAALVRFPLFLRGASTGVTTAAATGQMTPSNASSRRSTANSSWSGGSSRKATA